VKFGIGRRLGPSVAAGLVILSLACGRNGWSDSSGAAAPGTAVPSASPLPTPAAANSPAPPLSSPTTLGPLQMAPPNSVELPKLVPLLSGLPAPVTDMLKPDVNGVISGIGIVQNHELPGDFGERLDISNAQLIIQKPIGLIQYYLQVGGYSIPALGVPYIDLSNAVNALYGVLPAAYLKIAPSDSFSVMAGNLPTLLGAEYALTFANVNIERGLLWNQTNAFNRGVQLNYSQGKIGASLSWNNGFYSHSYTWMSGSLAYAPNPANTFTFLGGGNLGFAKSNNLATPLLNNNSQIYDLIYEYNASPWIVEPYVQWTVVPHNPEIDVLKSTWTIGGALWIIYALTEHFFLAGRWEFIGSTGNSSDGSANLLYGPGSQAWSFTLTPTFQYNQFFVRPEVSYVQALNYAPGGTFGSDGRNPVQVRGLLEAGVIF
jgi:hypothetical protein